MCYVTLCMYGYYVIVYIVICQLIVCFQKVIKQQMSKEGKGLRENKVPAVVLQDDERNNLHETPACGKENSCVKTSFVNIGINT